MDLVLFILFFENEYVDLQIDDWHCYILEVLCKRPLYIVEIKVKKYFYFIQCLSYKCQQIYVFLRIQYSDNLFTCL